MPDTDINTNTNVELEAESSTFASGPAEDDAEAMYEPDEIEATRGREQGLGVGARDLQLQRDPHRTDASELDGDLEQLNRDEMNTVDAIAESEVEDLSIDEEFDDPDAGLQQPGA